MYIFSCLEVICRWQIFWRSLKIFNRSSIDKKRLISLTLSKDFLQIFYRQKTSCRSSIARSHFTVFFYREIILRYSINWKSLSSFPTSFFSFFLIWIPFAEHGLKRVFKQEQSSKRPFPYRSCIGKRPFIGLI